MPRKAGPAKQRLKRSGTCPQQRGGSRNAVTASRKTDTREANQRSFTNSPNFTIYKTKGGRRFIYKTGKNGTHRVYLDPPPKRK